MNGLHATREIQREDIEFFQCKISDVARAHAASVTGQLGRVLSVSGLPDLARSAASGRVDFKKLIALRDSDEAREFRMWLLRADTCSEEDLVKAIGGLRKRMAPVMNAWYVKVLQILVLNAASLAVVGPAAGYAASVALGSIEAIILQKLFASSGPALFVNGKVRSLFDKE
jgi:hypothetical protein